MLMLCRIDAATTAHAAAAGGKRSKVTFGVQERAFYG